MRKLFLKKRLRALQRENAELRAELDALYDDEFGFGGPIPEPVWPGDDAPITEKIDYVVTKRLRESELQAALNSAQNYGTLPPLFKAPSSARPRPEPSPALGSD